jgi:hypothetical protein
MIVNEDNVEGRRKKRNKNERKVDKNLKTQQKFETGFAKVKRWVF